MTDKDRVFAIVKNIPKGKVMYFGQIAKETGISARQVGWILSGMKIEEWDIIPWYRVVAKNGYISSLKLGEKGMIQKQILLKQGYEIIKDRVNMDKHVIYSQT